MAIYNFEWDNKTLKIPTIISELFNMIIITDYLVLYFTDFII